jgi:hypothetical protein
MPQNRWTAVRHWLHTNDADWFIDAAVLGGLPKHEAEDLLQDFDIAATPEALSKLGREIDAALQDGR